MCRFRRNAYSGIFAGAILWAACSGAFAQHEYTSEDIQAGYRLYSSNCAVCHGSNGDGVGGINLARQQFHTVVTDDDIRHVIATGNAAGMPPFKLQPDEVNGLIAFIRSGFEQNGTSVKLGDAARGKAIYDGKGNCASCHRVNGEGAFTAPDLSDVGTIRQAAAIRRSLLEPTTGMLPINRPVSIALADGRTIRGRRLNEDTFTIQLIDDQGQPVAVAKSDIRKLELGKVSNMPSFADKLSPDETADLLAYLVSLKGK